MSKRILAARTCLCVLGILMLMNGIIAALTVNFHSGIAFALLLGAVLLSLGALYDRLGARICFGIRLAFFIALGVLAAIIAALYIGGSGAHVSYDEDAVIVLGAGVRGEEPAASLKSRLDAAVDYHFKNPTAKIVVSGGRGTGEDITEALAMERYLTARGVDPDVIVKEERATSTSENFAYSLELLDADGDDELCVAYITSDFHIFRAGLTAKTVGIEQAGYIGTRGSLLMLLPNGLRECAAILKFWILGY